MMQNLHRRAEGPRCILIVDDDEAFGHASTKILAAAGFDVVHAPDYRRALTLIESGRPIDLLVTDIVMPERVNGLALARMARLRRPEIKVLYVTGYEIPGIADEVLGTILLKPIDDERLVLEAARALGTGPEPPAQS